MLDPLENREQVSSFSYQHEETFQISREATSSKISQMNPLQIIQMIQMDPSQITQMDPSELMLIIQMDQSQMLQIFMIFQSHMVKLKKKEMKLKSQVIQPQNLEEILQAREEKIKQEVEAKFQAELADQKKRQIENRAILLGNERELTTLDGVLASNKAKLADVKETQAGIKETLSNGRQALSNGQKRLKKLENFLVL